MSSHPFTEFLNVPVLITGSTGFVGGHLTEKLLALGADVRLLVRDPNSESATNFESEGAKLFQGDLRSLAEVTEATEGVKFVFHVGAIFREAKFEDSVYFDINVGGTENVLRAAKDAGVSRVIYCSTNGVHGGHSELPIAEDAPFAPSDVYQESKVQSEHSVMAAFEKGLDVSIIRPAMIWGEGDLRFKKLFRGIARRRLPIIGDGKSWTHWIHVADLVNAFLLAALKEEASGQAFLIAGERPVRLEYVYETIAKLAEVDVLPFKIPALPIQIIGSIVETIVRPLGIEPPIHRRRADFFIKHRIFNTEKAQKLLSFKPALKFEAECERVFNWYDRLGHL